jgi:hypothetical protein
VAKGKHKLSRRQQLGVVALLEYPNVAEAARQSGIPLRTLRHWVATVPAFLEAVERQRRSALRLALGRVLDLTEKAADALERSLGTVASGNDPRRAGCETRAADVVLANAFKALEVFNLEERVAAIEEQLKTRGTP